MSSVDGEYGDSMRTMVAAAAIAAMMVLGGGCMRKDGKPAKQFVGVTQADTLVAEITLAAGQ